MRAPADDRPRPEPSVIKAKQTEISQRYSRAARLKAGGNIRWSELKRLFAARGHSGPSLDATIYDRCGPPDSWNADQLGVATNLTAREKIALGIRTLRCATREDDAAVAAHFREKKRKRDRDAKQAGRANGAHGRDNSERAKALLAVIADEWMTSAAVAKAAAGLPEFTVRRRRQLDADALRKAVNRGLKELAGCGQIAVHESRGQFGQRVWSVRRV